MDISALSRVHSAQTSGASADTKISSDFETFLVMLTAQMENQDPLNPLDSQDFATQLATFSGVEQQVKTNGLLSALAAQFAVSGLADMSGWVGMDARLAVPASFEGMPIEVLPNPPGFADRCDLVVRNQAGDVVQRVPIGVSDDPVFWDGVDSNGVPFGHGTYSFSVEAFSNEELIDTHTPDIFAQVQEIRAVEGIAVVVLEGGGIYPSTQVTGLR